MQQRGGRDENQRGGGGRRGRDGGRQADEPRQREPRGWLTPYPLPRDTARLVVANRDKCANLGLWLDRFVGWTEQGKEDKLQPMIDAKKRDVAALRDKHDGVRKRILMGNGEGLSQLIEACSERARQQRRAFAGRGEGALKVVSNTAVTDYRLVVGFGAEHILETSLTLHRIYGIPFIPGSAVKGITRAWSLWEFAESLKLKADSLPQLDELLSTDDDKERQKFWEKVGVRDVSGEQLAELEQRNRVFGTTGRRGEVVFFDAYPVKPPTLELDVLNPHYGDYYSSKGSTKPPADYLSPVPTYFLTVAAGCHFEFAVAGENVDLVNKAREWLTSALENLGVGGKTSAGYGFMKVNPEKPATT